MERAELLISGIRLQAPPAVARSFPSGMSYEKFPSHFCGAGRGIGEKLVPDFVYSVTRFLPKMFDISIKLSPACYIHDESWRLAAPSWEDFHDSNDMFYHNLAAIILARTTPGIVREHAMRYPKLYADAVEDFGRRLFWQLKRRQGLAAAIPVSARRMR